MTTTDVSASIAVGCAELPPGMNRADYFRRLSLLEMRLPNDRTPEARVARRWRADAGAGQLALVAPRDLCALHRHALSDLDAPAAALADTARNAQASAVLFPTPPGLTTSQAHRDLLSRFFHEVATADRFGGDAGAARVWQPDGLWRPTVAAAFAAELGVLTAVDPLAGDPLEEGIPAAPSETAYARVTGLGRPGRPLREDDLTQLADWAGASQRAFIVLATSTPLRDAVALARFLSRA